MGKQVSVSTPEEISSDTLDSLLKTPLTGAEDERLKEQEQAPAKPGTDGPDKPNEGEKPKPEEKKDPAQQPAAAAPEKPKQDPAAAPKPGDPPVAGEKLYAGKYKTTDDLKKGFLAAAKPLNYSPTFLEKVLSLAEKTGDWTGVEDLYKELDKAISEGRKATPAHPAGADPDPTKATPDAETVKRDRQAVAEYVATELITELGRSDIAQRLAEKGVPIPSNFMLDVKETKAYLAKLEEDGFPAEAIRLEQFLQNMGTRLNQEAAEVLKASKESQTYNQTNRDGAVTAIKDFAKKYNYELKDDELTAFLTEAIKDDRLFEQRHGVSFLREGALSDYWKLRNMDRLTEHIRINSENVGREQAAKDLKGLQTQGVRSIGTASLGSERSDKVPIDPADPAQRAALTSEQLDEAIKKGLPKPQ